MDATDHLVARRVREERLAAGVTQAELAEAVGVTTQQLQKFEKGINRVKAGQLWRIARRIDVPVDDLFRESGNGPATALQRNFVRAARGLPSKWLEVLAEAAAAMGGRR